MSSKTIVTADTVLCGFDADGEPDWRSDAAILIEDGRIAAIADAAALRAAHPDAEVLGGRDRVAIPGFVNAHHHLGLTPFQLGSPDHPLELWFASRLALRDVDPRLDTLYSAFEMIASGVTTVQHLQSRIAGSVDDVLAGSRAIIGAYRDIGMRVSYSLALRDQNRLVYEADEAFLQRVPPEVRAPLAAYFARFALPLAEQIAVFRALRQEYAGDPRVEIQIAPSNLHWLSDAALDSAAAMAAETGAPMHMHLLETPYQKAYARKRTGGSALAWIDRLGLTGPGLTLGHGVWMTAEDLDICAHTGTRICHNCSSNFRLQSGLAPVAGMLDRRIPVAIGIDEAGINDDRDMLQEMRLVMLAHRKPGIGTRLPAAREVLRMATEHGAGTTPFADRVGRIEDGRAADIVLIDWKRATWPYQDAATPLADALIQRTRREHIDTVIVGGDVVYAGGRFTGIDRDAVLEGIAERLGRPLTAAEASRRDLAEGVMPHVRRFYDGYLEGS